MSESLPHRTRSSDGGKDGSTERDSEAPFDIVSTYQQLLASDPDLTMPVAAIEALVSLLAATPSLTTISETLDVLAAASDTLKRAVRNSISLSAGTDLFTRYIVTTLRTGAFPNSPAAPANDFAAIRGHLLSNGRLFAARAKDARRAIARIASRFVREGSTVLTYGGSRVVAAVLQAAAEAQTREGGAPRFRVIYVNGSTTSAAGNKDSEGAATIEKLRALQVAVAEISEAAVAYSMGRVTVALVGAEGVVENGGFISRLGTYQLALLARTMGRPVYVVAESHKFVRLFPLGQYDLGVEQRVLDFRTGADGDGKRGSQASVKEHAEAVAKAEAEAVAREVGAPPSSDKTPTTETAPPNDPSTVKAQEAVATATTTTTKETSPLVVDINDAVDYTPPDLVTALITEAGVLTPSAVSEELIKIWY